MHNFDAEYLNIVNDILNDPDFLKLKSFEHHGITRYNHSVKVSYQAYKYAKKHGLDYRSVAIGGLLHDFFESSENPSTKEKLVSTFSHSEVALENARYKYRVTEKEGDIIVSHMFPFCTHMPKCRESWIVNLVDKKVGLGEWGIKFRHQLSYATNLFVLLLFNSIK